MTSVDHQVQQYWSQFIKLLNYSDKMLEIVKPMDDVDSFYQLIMGVLKNFSLVIKWIPLMLDCIKKSIYPHIY